MEDGIKPEQDNKIKTEIEKKANTDSEESKEQKVTPWEVSSVGKIDYMKLVNQFGTELLTQEILEKFKRITGKELHPWLKRGIFFTHRGFDKWLDAYENGEPVFLYTGRGPSSDAMHIGHLIPFMFTKWLQDVFDCPLIIQISDEEKAAFKKIDFNILYKMGFENAHEIISLDFNSEKTFIFSNRDYRLKCPSFEILASEMKMKVPMKIVKDIFGFNEESTIAMWDWPFYQTAAAFYQAYPHIFGGRPAHCLIPFAIDQDPYFRMARDVAPKMNLIKPCTIECTFIPPLTGVQGKMSSSVSTDSTLFLTDSAQILRKKVLANCYSGGGGNGTLEDHRKYGGNPDVDIAYQYLRYFEENDEALNKIHDSFKKGEMTCGEIKELLVKKLVEIYERIQNRKSQLSKEHLDEFYKLKPIELPKPKERKLEEPEKILYNLLNTLDVKYRTKYHSLLTTIEEAEDLARSVEGSVCKSILLKGPKDAYYLYVIKSNTYVNTKTLHKRIGVSKVNFATKDTFVETLRIPNTCPTIFGLVNDTEKRISTILIEEGIPKDSAVNFHPLRADATTTIAYEDMIKFIEHLKYEIKYVKE
jgi:tryptophanyl-tRNA synthetase